MPDKEMSQQDRINGYNDALEKIVSKAVRPYRADGYMNLLNRYGTSKDMQENYRFEREPMVEDTLLTEFYEGNGLFAKIIDTPAEEAVKHGFTLEDVSDSKIEDFYTEALDELDWEEKAMTAIKWSRLFGGSIAIMLINDGRGIDEPLDWKNIKSIDEIRVYDRSLIQPEYQSLYHYDPKREPFSTRGSRLGFPEHYYVTSKYGNFTVHDSRCLVFQNGTLPENTSNSNYEMWGIPEYIRIHRAIRDAEIAHSSAPKMMEKSVQPVYKMKDLAMLLATEEGESKVLKRLEVIDTARGMLNSLVIDSEGEDYDFRSFAFTGINDVLGASCSMLSAITNIPQMILFGSGVGGLSSTDDSSMENYYNFVERIQKKMLRSNLRYLLSVIFQAGLHAGEIDEVPAIKVNFNPLWSMSDSEKRDIDLKDAQIALTKAQTAQTYVDMQAIDPTEVRKKLADSDDFIVEQILDEVEDDLSLEDIMMSTEKENSGAHFLTKESLEAHKGEEVNNGRAPIAAPNATRLPEDMDDGAQDENVDAQEETDVKPGGVGVVVVKDGMILCGTRHNDTGYGLICGPGGHIDEGETPEEAALRETEEEFGIRPLNLVFVGHGPLEPETGFAPYIYFCDKFEGEPSCDDLEMVAPKFRTLEELKDLDASLYPAFKDGVMLFIKQLENDVHNDGADTHDDGGSGSGNHGHEGVPGSVGGSAPTGKTLYDSMNEAIASGDNEKIRSALKDSMKKMPTGSSFDFYGTSNKKISDDEWEMEDPWGEKTKLSSKEMEDSVIDTFEENDGEEDLEIIFEIPKSEKIAEAKVLAGELEPEETSVMTAEYNGPTNEYVERAVYSDMKSQFQNNAGREFSDEEVAEMVDAVTEYTGGDYVNILAAQTDFKGRYEDYAESVIRDSNARDKAIKDAENVEKALKYADKYDGEVYRALGFDLDGPYSAADGFEQLMKECQVGETFNNGTMSSWTTKESILNQIWGYRAGISEECTVYAEVKMVCKSKTGVDIQKMAVMNQSEVLFSKDANFVVKSVNRKEDGDDDYTRIRVEIELEEIV